MQKKLGFYDPKVKKDYIISKQASTTSVVEHGETMQICQTITSCKLSGSKKNNKGATKTASNINPLDAKKCAIMTK